MGFVFVCVWLVMGTSVILWGFVYGYYYKVLLRLYCGYIGAGLEQRRTGDKYGNYCPVFRCARCLMQYGQTEHKKIPSTAIKLSTAFCVGLFCFCFGVITFHCFKYRTVNKSVQAFTLLFGVGFYFLFVAFGYSDFYFIVRRLDIFLCRFVLCCAVSCHCFTSAKYNITF